MAPSKITAETLLVRLLNTIESEDRTRRFEAALTQLIADFMREIDLRGELEARVKRLEETVGQLRRNGRVR